ncbi:MAG: hypothetical protein GY754_21215 [bacterium]|nr:hypothetical protein [bacterium]
MRTFDPGGNKFVNLIEEHHQEIIEHFMNDILKNSKTSGYQNLNRKEIYNIGDRVYRELSKFVSGGHTEDDVGKLYKKIGQKRYNQGIPFSHVFEALVLLKRHLWLYVQENLELEISDLQQAIALSNKVVLFFDRAALFMLEGYESEIYKKF